MKIARPVIAALLTAAPLLCAAPLLTATTAFAQAEDVALIAPPLLDGSPRDGAIDVPINTLVWTSQFTALQLIGPDGAVEMTEVASIQSLAGPIRAFDPGELPAETTFSVLDEAGDFTVATFTTGTEPAAAPTTPEVLSTDESTGSGPVPLITTRRFLSVRVEWSGLFLIVEPDGASIDEIANPEEITEFEFLNYELDGSPIEKRLVAVNVAGELSDEGLLTYAQGGCASVTGEALALWPILGLIACGRRVRRRRAQKES